MQLPATLPPLGRAPLYCPANRPYRLTEKYSRPVVCVSRCVLHRPLQAGDVGLPLVSRPHLGVQYPSAARRSLSRCGGRQT